MIPPKFPAVIDSKHLERQRAWSAATFGPGTRLLGVLDHIKKELVEVEADPGDVTEWADVLILAFDGAMRSGHEPQAIIDAIKAKQARNEARTWPDWRGRSEHEAIEHDRTIIETPAIPANHPLLADTGAMPAVGVVRFTPVCPDCQAGKCGACVGAAWDDIADEPAACQHDCPKGLRP